MALILCTLTPADVHKDPDLRAALVAALDAAGLGLVDVYKTEIRLNLDGCLFLRVHRYAPRLDGQRQPDPDQPHDLLTQEPVDLHLPIEGT